MNKELLPLLTGEVLEEQVELSLEELCHICQLTADQIRELVEEGIIEPQGADITVWCFQGTSVRRVRRALHLQRDLGVNWAGAALALEMLDELQLLRARLRRLEE